MKNTNLKQQYEIGMVGLGVMGRNLLLNMADHGFSVAGYDNDPHLLENWMKSYKPEELFDERGCLLPDLAELAPKGERRMGANPHANGGLLLHDLVMPDFQNYKVNNE